MFFTYKKTSHAKSKDDGQGWCETKVNDTLNIFDNGEVRTPTLIVQPLAVESHAQDARYNVGYVNQTLGSNMEHDPANGGLVIEPLIYDARGNGDGSVCGTITGIHQSFISDYTAIALENRPQDSRIKIKEDGIIQTLDARMGEGGGNTPMVMERKMESKWVVRRLTPLECERLQGYPDGWTDIGDWTDSKGRTHKGDADAPRYKALGNSIALPFWEWMAERIVKVLKEDGVENPTMCSLFDGIGGFPLVFSRCGCEPVWASEIEEFPIAVTKRRFPEKEDNNDPNID